MRFEHLVEINDPLNPLLDPLSRAQLWKGLVRRAERPTEFVLGLADATIHARVEDGTETELARTLDFGAFEVHDHVRLAPLSHTEIRTAASPHFPASRLLIRIEEPQPDRLYLRFVYESEVADGSGELDITTATLRNQAYERADLDTVAHIRRLAEQGALG
ncbi:MAG: DUF1857 family protein [Burkholderiaceae bacterium]|nr:DUF1857 family protein [Burkholderiaceae bacterium]